MELEAVVARRRMVRNFDDRPIPPEATARILANMQRGPSAGFSQGFELLVLEAEADRARFWAAVSPDSGFERSGWPGVYRAPLLIVPFADKTAYLDRYAEPDKGWTDRDEARWPVPYWYIDTGFAALLALLTAVEVGLGALLFGVRDAPALRATFGVPERFEPIGALAIGYPLPHRPSRSLARGRRSPREVVHRGIW